MAKASAKKKPAPKKPSATNTDIVEQGHDPFNGFVYLKTDGKQFWAEHERKGIVSEKTTEANAREQYKLFIDDGQFA